MGRRRRARGRAEPSPFRYAAAQGWRLDAVAVTEGVRSLAASLDGTSLAYVHDRDGSQRFERFLDCHLI